MRKILATFARNPRSLIVAPLLSALSTLYLVFPLLEKGGEFANRFGTHHVFFGIALGVTLSFLMMWLAVVSSVIAAKAQIPNILRRADYPVAFCALEMLWPKRLREEVWHPAFYDEQALYLALRDRSWLPMLNIIFALKVLYLVVVTGRIAFLDWSLSRLTNKRSRLTGGATRRKGKVD